MSVPEIDLAEFEAHLRKAHTKRKARKKPVRERDVEGRHVECVRADGGESYKFTSPGRRAVPDRLDLYGVDRMVPMLDRMTGGIYGSENLRVMCEALLAEGVELTECKKPGEVPTDAQAREHARLRARGFKVNVLAHVKDKPPKETEK